MSDQIWIRQGENVQGPFGKDQVLAWILGGKVHGAMMFSADGKNWRPVAEAAEFFSAPATAARAASAARPTASRRRSRPERDAREARHPEPRARARSGPPVAVWVGGALALIALSVVAFAMVRSKSGGSAGGGASARKGAPAWPQGPDSSPEAWRAALVAWGSPDSNEIATQGRILWASPARAPFLAAATTLMRSGTPPPPLESLVRAVDGAGWRKRPALAHAKWKGLDAYRRLEPYERGEFVSKAELGSVDVAIGEVVAYDKEVGRDEGARQEDRVRATLDPEGLGYVMVVRDGPWTFLARNGIPQADVLTRQKIAAAVLRSVWPFVSKKDYDSMSFSKAVLLQFDREARGYAWGTDDGPRLYGSVRLPYGDTVESRLAAATALIATAYDVAMREGVARNREGLGPVFGFRWGFAFANYPSDITPLRIPQLQDRGRGALKKALGVDPRVPEFGRVLAASLLEDLNALERRINDMDEVQRAAYEFLAYRLLLNSPLVPAWPKERVRAVAEGTPLSLGKSGVTWSDFVHLFEQRDARIDAEVAAYVESLHQLFPTYVAWVLDDEPK